MAESPTIRLGDRSGYVKEAQERLNLHLHCGLQEDGTFGSEMRDAVIRFQQLKGLTPDGIVGPQTWQALWSEPQRSTTVSSVSHTHETMRLYQRNRNMLPRLTYTSGMENEFAAFENAWKNSKARYEGVARQVNLPAALIAAIHYRESSNNFNTYLHNGDPLGKRTVHVPAGILFYDWESAANDAIKRKESQRKDLGLTYDSTDGAAIAAFAEYYNGLGYYKKNICSPYVFSGTNVYSCGLYIADHQFDPHKKDSRPGVLALMNRIGFSFSNSSASSPPLPPYHPESPVQTSQTSPTIRLGDRSGYVKEAQERLNLHLHCGLQEDGTFGSETRDAVIRFQQLKGLTPDGIVGPQTWQALWSEP